MKVVLLALILSGCPRSDKWCYADHALKMGQVVKVNSGKYAGCIGYISDFFRDYTYDETKDFCSPIYTITTMKCAQIEMAVLINVREAQMELFRGQVLHGRIEND